MADFEKAFAITSQNEGGLSNDAHDGGLFTYAGISSKYWPNWKGWPIVKQILADNHNDFHASNTALKNNATVQQLVKGFYKQNFWDVNKLDQFKDQQLGQSCYDFGVNAGVGTAAKTLQRCLGITADGIIGSGTLQAVNNANAENLYNAFNEARKSYYGAIIARDPSQKVFEHSWLSRLTPYKK